MLAVAALGEEPHIVKRGVNQAKWMRIDSFHKILNKGLVKEA